MPETRTESESKPEPRKPYEPPRIVSREPLEAMAAVCSPRPPAKSNAGLCPRGPINS
jgi:hypothetical protein